MLDKPPTVVFLYCRLWGISYSPRNLTVLILAFVWVARFSVLQDAVKKTKALNSKARNDLDRINGFEL